MIYKVYQWELFPSNNRKFVFFLKYMGWHVVQLGISVDLKMGNIELFFPFGFLHLGLESKFDTAKRKELK